MRFAHHLHCLAPLKIAVDRRVPACVLLRKPIEAISSRFIQLLGDAGYQSHLGTIGFDRLRWLLEDWLNYYEYVASSQGDILVIPFEEAIALPWATLNSICEFAEVQVPPDLESRWRVFHAGFASRDASKAQGSTSFPDKRRNELKRPVKEYLSALDEISMANQLYERLSASVGGSLARPI